MLALLRFVFLSFLVCCFCKNKLGHAGSYKLFKQGDFQVSFYSSAFTVSKDDAQTALQPASLDLSKYSDFAAYRVPKPVEKEKYEVFASSGNDVYLLTSTGDVYPSASKSDNPRQLSFNDNYFADFYSYKGEIREYFGMSHSEKHYYSTTEGEKVSESELKEHIDFTTVVPKFSKYTEFFKATYDEEFGKVGVLTNKKDGVVGTVWEHEDGKVEYNACVWKDPDEIQCSVYRITFSGSIISRDGSSVSVVSCLVFFISVLVLSLL